jgi:signal transduction histidine kinase
MSGRRRRALLCILFASLVVPERLLALEQEAIWSLSLAAQWYERWWFRLSVFAVILLLIWLETHIAVSRQTAKLRREFSVQLGERTRTAGELHDTLLQGFQGAILQLHSLATKLTPDSPERKHLERVLSDVQDVLNDGRKSIWALRESTTTGPDLHAAFTRVANHFGAASPTFQLTEEGDPRPMNPIQRDILYLLGREALMNAFRHSGGRQIQMNLYWEPQWFRFVVRDDGVGIPEGTRTQGREGHFGLAGMQERAGQLGARFDIRSSPGRGTEVSVAVPAASIDLQPSRPKYRTLLSRLIPWGVRQPHQS